MKFFSNSRTDYDKKFKTQHGDNGLKEPSFVQGVIVPAVEKYLEKERSKIKTNAHQSAVDTANGNRPYEKGDILEPYIKFIAEDTGLLCNYVSKELQADGLLKYKKLIEKFADAEKEELEEAKPDLSNKVLNTKRDLRNLADRDIYPWAWFPLMIVGIMVGLLGDLLYNAKALQSVGLNYLESLVIVVPVVGGLAFAGYFFFNEFKKDETEKKSTGILGISLIFILGIFAAMGYVRVFYLNEVSLANVSPLFGTLMFVVLNILIFGFVSAIFHKFWPTSEQRKIRKNWRKTKKELRHLEKALNKIKNNLVLLKRWRSDNIQIADELVIYHNDLLKENIGFYRSIVANWIREVTTRLPFTPDCTTQKPPQVSCKQVQLD